MPQDEKTVSQWLQDEKPAPRPSVSEWLAQDAAEDARAAGPSFDAGGAVDPSRAARVVRLQFRTRLHPELIDRNLDEIERETRRADFDAEMFRRKSTVVADWVRENRYYASLTRDDVGKLANLEQLLTRPRALWPKPGWVVQAEAKKYAERRLAELQADVAAGRVTHFRPGLKYKGGKVVPSGLPKGLLPEDEEIDPSAHVEMWRQQRLKVLEAQERFISGDAPVGFIESLEREGVRVPFVSAALDAVELAEVYWAAKALEAGGATPEQRELLLDYGRVAMAEEWRGTDAFGIAGGILAGLPAFVGEFASTGGSYTATKAAASKLLRGAIGKLLRGRAKAVVLGGARAIVGSAAQTAIAASPRIVADTIRRMTPHSEIGDDLEPIIATEGDDFLPAFLKATATNYVEVLSERTGVAADGLLKPLKAAVAARWLGKPGRTSAALAKMLKASGWNGVIGEVFEERVAEVMKIPIEGYRPPTGEQLAGEVLAFLVPGAALAAPRLALDRAPKERRKAPTEALKTLGAILETTKLAQTSPEALGAILDRAAKGTDLESLSITTEDWDGYWQGKKREDGGAIDGRAAAEELLGSAAAYDEAKARGGNLAIPMGLYTEKLLATPHHAGLVEHLKADPREDTARELKAVEEEAAKREAPKETDEGRKRREELAAHLAEIEESMRGMIERAGFKREARTHARLATAMFRTLAERTGIAPQELFRQFGLRIEREGRPAQAAPVATGTTQVGVVAGQPVPPPSSAAAGQPEAPAVAGQAIPVPPGAMVKPTTEGGYLSDAGERTLGGYFPGEAVGHAIIRIFQGADRSTMIHEFGHFFLDVMTAVSAMETAPTQLREDFEALLKWFGVKDRAAWDALGFEGRRQYHERFSEAFEEYMREGRAPSVGLRGVFRRAMDWLTEIYRAAVGEGGLRLTNDVRRVMDRMLATDAEIAEALQETEAAPLIENPAGIMSSEDAARYSGAVESARVATFERLVKKATEDIRREDAAWWKTERAKVRALVAGEVDAMPVFVALANMQRGTRPDGSALPQGEERVRLSKHDVAGYPPGIVKELPRGITVDEGGVHPDTAAAIFGFASGETLLRTLARPIEEIEATAEEKALRAELARLEAEQRALEDSNEPLKEEERLVSKEVLARREAVASRIAKGLREQELASVQDIQALVSEIRGRGGVYPVVATEVLPRSMRGSKATGVASDELARELSDRGVIEDASSDTLYQWAAAANDRIKEARQRAKEAGKKAKKLAAGTARRALERLVDNVTAQERLRVALAEVTGSAKAVRGEVAAFQRRARVIDRLTDERMRTMYGEPLSEEELEAEAVKDVHGMEREKVLRLELEALVRMRPAAFRGLLKTVTAVPDTEVLAEEAREAIAPVRVRALKARAREHLAAERKAGEAARDAFSKGNIVEAFKRKRHQLVNHALYLAVEDAMVDVDGVRADASRLAKDETLRKIGKGKPEHADQIMTLLERYDFRPPRAGEERARKTLAEFVAQQRAAGWEPVVADRLLNEARRVNYQDAGVEELRDLGDALRSIEQTAKNDGQVRRFHEYLDKEVAVDELVKRAEHLPEKKRETDPGLVGWEDWLRRSVATLDAWLTPVETLIEELDGGPVGPWHDLVWTPLARSEERFLTLMEEFGGKVGKLVTEHRKDSTAAWTDAVDTPLGRMSRLKLVGIAFNYMNESNADKMIRGEAMRGNNWNATLILGALARLEKRDLDFVQKAVDAIEGMWPMSEEIQRRVSGLAAPKIQPRAFTVTLTDGTEVKMRGGYYPLDYDRMLVEFTSKLPSDTTLGGLIEEGWVSATTPASARKKRTGFAAPINYDWRGVLQKHLAGVLKDIAYRESIMDVQKLLSDPRVRKEIQARVGPEYEKLLAGPKGWLGAVAGEYVSNPVTPADRFFERARSHIVTATLGFKATSILSQFSGLSNSLEYVSQHYGAKFFTDAMTKFLRNVPKNLMSEGDGMRAVMEQKAPEMRQRNQTMERDYRDLRKRIERSTLGAAMEWLHRAGMYGIAFCDRMIAIPTWTAAYNGALARRATEEQAVEAGSAAVRRSQGSGGAKDLTALQRQRGAISIFTMFMSPFAAQYGRLRSIGAALKRDGWKYTPEAIMRVALVAWIPGIVAALLAGRGPTGDDEDEEPDAKDVARWAAVKALSGTTAGIPGVRDIANTLEQSIEQGRPVDTRFSPVITIYERSIKTFGRAGMATFGEREWDDELTFDVFEASGYIFGLPTAQPAITAEYLYDLMHDEAEVSLHDLMFRRSPGERRGR